MALTWTTVALMCVNLGVWTQLLVGGMERQRGRKFAWNQWGGTKSTGGGTEGGTYKMKNLGEG
jgi:hypothetical protein